MKNIISLFNQHSHIDKFLSSHFWFSYDLGKNYLSKYKLRWGI